jgi:hypothetical protein
MSKKSRRIGWIFLAAILLAFPVYVMITWMESFKGGLPYAENLANYLKHFPKYLQSKASIAWIALMLNIISNGMTIGMTLSKKAGGRIWSVILLTIGVVVMIWLGFTLF